jgi:GNAT superfamily N-acetyltransferase
MRASPGAARPLELRMPTYRIRQAAVSDAPVIARHRVKMFQDIGTLPAGAMRALESASERRLFKDLASGDYVGWLTEADGEIVAGAGLLLHDYYPSRNNLDGRPTAYILNVYTEPQHRRRGLARQLLSEILDWCRAQRIPRASLHASSFGRSVYEQLRFAPTNEMRRELDPLQVSKG